MSKLSNNQYNLVHALNYNPKAILNMPQDDDVTAADFFAGGGGVTEALYTMPNVTVSYVLNHDTVAVKTNQFHHPDVKHYLADVYVQDERELDPVDLVWASIECTQHSKAKGGGDKAIGSYTMGWELVRYIVHIQPKVIGIENVPEFKKWAPICSDGKPIATETGKEFERWKKTIMDMGYNYCESIRNAADDGLPTRRVRYFAFFYRDGIDMSFPEFTHSKTGGNGKLKWEACRNHIDLANEGISIFGREFNEALPKHLRKPLSKNSLRRIGGGAKKQHPEYTQFICNYYGGLMSKLRSQGIDSPLNTVVTANMHQLISMEKLQFIMDHCHTDNYNTLDEPLNPQLTRQTKQMVTFAELEFICQYYGTLQSQSLDVPLNTVRTNDCHQKIRIEKAQFIAHYFNSSDNPESQTQSLDTVLNSVMTTNKAALITVLFDALDAFDIKARFLDRDELGSCMTFPKNYFNTPGLQLSNKAAIKMIGNAVPPEWARLIIEPNIPKIKAYKQRQKIA